VKPDATHRVVVTKSLLFSRALPHTKRMMMMMMMIVVMVNGLIYHTVLKMMLTRVMILTKMCQTRKKLTRNMEL
jgi:hypothetical protein